MFACLQCPRHLSIPGDWDITKWVEDSVHHEHLHTVGPWEGDRQTLAKTILDRQNINYENKNRVLHWKIIILASYFWSDSWFREVINLDWYLTDEKQPLLPKLIWVNCIILSFSHICEKGMISACNCSLIPFLRLISLPRNIPDYTCSTCVVIKRTPFHSYHVLVWMIYGEVFVETNLNSEVWYIWIKIKKCFYSPFVDVLTLIISNIILSVSYTWTWSASY